MNTTGKHIIVHKTGEEGAMMIDARTGSILTPSNERPVWADGYAAAILGERVGWYEKRLGEHLADKLRSPEVLNVVDLSWVALDENLDEVEIEHDPEFRQNLLSQIMEIGTSAEDFDKLLETYSVGAELAHTYETHPASEETLREAEGASFQEVSAASGSDKGA